ncbi:MAG TPA: hypothetical protein VHE35_33440, partial [Kofleriaceae bacterium]|nr:hypothetical protein [Kofleriaceae bacterium]
MAPETLPVLRCESRRRPPEPRWGVLAAVVVLLASTVDALWLVPAQHASDTLDPFGVRYRCFDLVPAELVPDAPADPHVVAEAPAAPAHAPTASVRVDGVLL